MSFEYFGGAIARHALERPTAPALIGPEGGLDFAGLQRAIEGVAGALHAAGIARGMVTALALRNRPRDLVTLLALLRLGAPMLTFDPAEPAESRRRLSARAGVRMVVGEPADAFDPALPLVTPTAAWQAHPPIALPPPPPETISYMTRSSGTTGGISKLVPTDHAGELARHRATFTRFPYGPEDRFLVMMQFSFAISRDFAIRSLSRGGGVIVPPPLRSLPILIRAAEEHRATWMVVTPVHLRDLMRHRGPGPLFPEVKVLCTSAALNPRERRDAMARVSPHLYINYGTTEVGTLAMASPADLAETPNVVGRVEQDIEAQAVDDRDRPLPAGEVGALRFRHPRFARAYLDADPAASSRFAEGWFYPGDLGVIDAGGRIHLKGRLDDVINVSGRKVHPADIEACLHTHPSVRDAVAIGLPSRRLGAVPVALAVANAGITEDILLDHCRAALGNQHAPRRIALVDVIPRTEAGKVDRLALAALVRSTLAGVDGTDEQT